MEELRENNRFAGGKVETFADRSQELIAPNYENAIANIKDFSLLELVVGNELTCITHDVYKGIVEDSSKFWWLLAEANNIDKAWDIDSLAGQSLNIPDVVQFKLNR